MGLFEDKVSVITGAASGIGEATAKRYAENDAKVIVADVDKEGGQATVEDIVNNDGEATFVETDVSRSEDIQKMIETAVAEYGGIDVLFNNAGIEGPVTDIASYDEEGFDEVLAVNLKGVWLGMKYGIQAMLEDGGGSIISTSSIGGQVAVPEYSGYGAAKAGVSLITKTAAIEYAEKGIRANAVAPGIVRTPMIQRVIEENPEAEAQFNEMEPMSGLTDPEEIADVVLFLGSDLSRRVTGVTVPVEGGFLSQ